MPEKDIPRQQSISEMLTSKTSGTADDVTDRTGRTWDELAIHLTPFIGEAGFCALFARAVRLAQPEFIWLTIVSSGGQSRQVLFETFSSNLQSADPRIAAQANGKVLEIFTGLLSTLIGEALVTRILNAAWIENAGPRNTGEIG